MAYKVLEALDETMKDLRNNHSQFGGAIILLAGDFHQTRDFTVNTFMGIPKKTKQECRM